MQVVLPKFELETIKTMIKLKAKDMVVWKHEILTKVEECGVCVMA